MPVPSLRPIHNRSRLVLVHHEDPERARAVADEFLFRGFETLVVADRAGALSLCSARRPDLIVSSCHDEAGCISEAVDFVGEIRALWLAIAVCFLATGPMRAEAVTRIMRARATQVFSDPIEARQVVQFAEEFLRGGIQVVELASGATQDVLVGFAALTRREQEICAQVVSGKSSEQIAQALGLSPRTVEVHRRHMMAKVGARNPADLVRLALGRGLPSSSKE